MGRKVRTTLNWKKKKKDVSSHRLEWVSGGSAAYLLRCFNAVRDGRGNENICSPQCAF